MDPVLGDFRCSLEEGFPGFFHTLVGLFILVAVILSSFSFSVLVAVILFYFVYPIIAISPLQFGRRGLFP